MVQLQLQYAPYPNLKPALLPRFLLPVQHPLPSCPHPGTLQDLLLPQYPVLSNYIHRFPCAIAKPHKLLSGSFRLSRSRKQTQPVSGLRWEPTLKVWQTFSLFAVICCIFPFAQIHFHIILQMRLQQYTED